VLKAFEEIWMVKIRAEDAGRKRDCFSMPPARNGDVTGASGTGASLLAESTCDACWPKKGEWQRDQTPALVSYGTWSIGCHPRSAVLTAPSLKCRKRACC